MPNLKHIWQRSFLYKLKQQNKLLFFVVVGWLVINLLTSVFGHQTTPFYQWAMYAPPVSEKNEYGVTEIAYAAGYGVGADSIGEEKIFTEPHTWNDYRTLMVRYTTDNYLKLSDTNYRPPEYATIKKIAAKLNINTSPFLGRINPVSVNDDAFHLWLVHYLAQIVGGRNIQTVRILQHTVCYDSLGHVHLVQKTSAAE